MAFYKLQNALAGVYPGNKEYHFGYLCEVREDGIWADLDPITAANWVSARRVHGPLQYERPEVKPVEAPKAEEALKAPEVPFERVIVETPVAEEKPQTMKEVMEEGTGKRGRPAKAPKA